MIHNGLNNARNELSMLKSVWLEVLQVYTMRKLKKSKIFTIADVGHIWFGHFEVKMISNGQNNARNEFSMLNSVGLDVLHVYMMSKLKKLGFSLWQLAAIFDSDILKNVPGWCSITSVIFQV